MPALGAAECARHRRRASGLRFHSSGGRLPPPAAHCVAQGGSRRDRAVLLHKVRLLHLWHHSAGAFWHPPPLPTLRAPGLTFLLPQLRTLATVSGCLTRSGLSIWCRTRAAKAAVLKTQRGDGGDGANLHPVRTPPLPPPREWMPIVGRAGAGRSWVLGKLTPLLLWCAGRGGGDFVVASS